jgi:transposase-like protein
MLLWNRQEDEDETYIKVKGEWRYLYRAVDKEGYTVDFLLTKRRQRMSAQTASDSKKCY